MGGVALALQNLVLAAIVARGLAFPAVLMVNTIVGLALLLAINLATAGPAFVGAVAGKWQTWFLLPGLLGTFVVFCMVFGYSRAGAAAPTIGLIAGQLLGSVALDALGATGRTPSTSALLGAALVGAGAVLVVLARD
jgi:transporter family-2 protein